MRLDLRIRRGDSGCVMERNSSLEQRALRDRGEESPSTWGRIGASVLVRLGEDPLIHLVHNTFQRTMWRNPAKPEQMVRRKTAGWRCPSRVFR